MRAVVPLALAAVVLVAGCGEIPQPYRHEGQASALARPKLTRGVAVHPPEDGARGEVLAQALVKALEDQEIAATVQRGPAFGPQIDGRTDDLGPVIDVFWTIRTPDGTELAGARQSVPKTLLVEGEEKRLKATAMSSAALLAQPLADPDAKGAPGPAQVAPDNRIKVKLLPLAGLPGDGDKSLGEAMRRSLGRGGMLVTDADAAYVVEGKVTVAAGLPNEDTVTVAWIVKQITDGAELANIGQSGAVPKGRLNQSWGALARDIADGGAAGVVQALEAAKGQRNKAIPR